MRRCIGILLLIVLPIGLWRISAERQRLIEASLNSAYLSVAAYAQAAEQWLANEDMDTLLRVTHIMLTGRTNFVEIRDAATSFLKMQAPIIAPGRMPHISTAIAITPQRSLSAMWSSWTIKVAIPIKGSSGTASEVYVETDAEPLRMQIIAMTLKISAIGLVSWLAMSGATFILFRRQRARIDSKAARVEDDFGWVVDSDNKRISHHNRPIPLTPKQYSLLSLLILGNCKVFSEEEILEAIWPHSSYADSNDIRQCVYKIRRRVQKAAPGAETCIANQKGFGYRFDSSECSFPPDEVVPSPTEPKHLPPA